MRIISFKSAIAVILAVVMAFGSFGALGFSHSEGDVLIWDFYADKYYYDYAGSLIVGSNTIAADCSDGWDYDYYTLEVENAGYYMVSSLYDEVGYWIGVPGRIENGIAYDSADSIYNFFEDGSGEGYVFHAEKGINVIAFDISFMPEGSATITVDYLGEKADGISVEDELIIGDDIVAADDGYCWIFSEISINFSNGKSIVINELLCEIDGELEEGEIVLTPSLLGKEFTLTVNAVDIDTVVRSIEISNIEEYAECTLYYDGVDWVCPEDETLTVTFADGSVYTGVFDGCAYSFDLPNGREGSCYIEYYYDENDNLMLGVYSLDCLFASYECTVTDATPSENIRRLNENNIEALDNALYYIQYAFEYISYHSSIYEFIAEDGILNTIGYLDIAALFLRVFATGWLDLLAFYL